MGVLTHDLVGSDLLGAAKPGKAGKCGEPGSIADPAAIGEEIKVWKTMARERANAGETPDVLLCLLGSEAAAVRPSATDDVNPRDGPPRSQMLLSSGNHQPVPL
jgi:hypothetical protein